MDFKVIILVIISLNILTKVLNAFKGVIKSFITIFLRYSAVEIAVNLLPSYTENIFAIYIYHFTPKVLSLVVFNNQFDMNFYID